MNATTTDSTRVAAMSATAVATASRICIRSRRSRALSKAARRTAARSCMFSKKPPWPSTPSTAATRIMPRLSIRPKRTSSPGPSTSSVSSAAAHELRPRRRRRSTARRFVFRALREDTRAHVFHGIEAEHANARLGAAAGRRLHAHVGHVEQAMQHPALRVDVLDARVVDGAHVAEEEALVNHEPVRREAVAVDPLPPQRRRRRSARAGSPEAIARSRGSTRRLQR